MKIYFTGTTRLSLDFKSAVVTAILESVSQRTSSVNSMAQFVQNSSHVQSYENERLSMLKTAI